MFSLLLRVLRGSTKGIRTGAGDSGAALKSLLNTAGQLIVLSSLFFGAYLFQKTKEIGKIKAKNNLPSTDKNRELKQLKRILKIAKEIDLDTVFAEKIFNLIVNEVKNNHNKMKK